ncbi:MAG TPA: hypothetical protein VNK04_07205 [Gemmataceae bacterium]|nr:hypothetical protein [Gemmataceae bacterium]
MSDDSPVKSPGRSTEHLAGLALVLLAVVCLGPLLADRPPVAWAEPFTSAAERWGAKVLVILLMGLAVGLRARLDCADEPRPRLLALTLVLLAGLMTACHGLLVDQFEERADWQRALYLQILNHHCDPPHQYRPLPYGFVRGLERLTGDWWFSCVAYRWFFTYWFLWGCYRFARLFHAPRQALLALLSVPLLYPFSVLWYWGQLTDPLSHALFVLALIYLVQDRRLLLAGTLALGVMAKETVLLVVPGYAACYWRRGWPTLARTIALGAAGAAAFLVVRLPLGWRPGNADLNGLDALMIGTNLGIGTPIAHSAAPLYQNYLQPLLFVGTFLPFIIGNWRRLDGRLRIVFLTLTPLLLLSNLCFGWMYESRNYMPLVPLLASMAVPPHRPAQPPPLPPQGGEGASH